MKKWIYWCLLIGLLLFFIGLNRLVEPKYKTELIEGSLVSDYYTSIKDHEVLFIGDCEIYANFSPLEMYRVNGIKAYNRAGSQQMLWQSYYMLKETLQYETPKLIVLSVGALRNGVSIKNEAYNRLNIDQMRWSKEKIEMIQVSKTSNESILSYLFPILRYHDRIFSLTKEDLAFYFSKSTVSYNGFLLNQDIVPASNLPIKRNVTSHNFDEQTLTYLDKIVELCKEKGMDLLLVKAPSLYPYWYDVQDAFVEEYANTNDIGYLNLIDKIEEIGIDFSQDTYDGGLHLNYTGAVKNSIYMSNYIKEHYDITDYRGDKEYDQLLEEYDKAVKE